MGRVAEVTGGGGVGGRTPFHYTLGVELSAESPPGGAVEPHLGSSR